MCVRFLRGHTEMHFNRVVVAVVGDGTELSISVFILSGRLILFPHPLKTKKTPTNPPSVYIPEMPERLGREHLTAHI